MYIDKEKKICKDVCTHSPPVPTVIAAGGEEEARVGT